MRACVRCTLFPSPMSEPRLGYFRDISFERERGEKKTRYGENARGERDDACVRACVRMLSRRECHRSISRGGWNFWPSRGGSVEEIERRVENGEAEKEKERDRGNLSRVGGEKGEEREGRETTRRWTDGWASGSLPHLRAHPPIWIARWSTHE